MNEIRNGLAEATSKTVGAQLRTAREAQGLSIGEIAERTRIPMRHITSIENDDHRSLPAATYSSGFVKTVARLLGLDGQTMAQQFRVELSENAPRAVFHEVYQPADPARTPTRGMAWIALVAAAALVIGFLYWRGMRSEDPVTVAATAIDVAPAPVVPRSTAPGPAPVASGSAAVLTADSPVWLRISEPDGAKLFEGLLDTGKSFTVPITAADPRLLTSRPNALKVMVGGTVIPPLGPPERRIRDVSLKPAALLARASAAPGGEPSIPTPEPASANPVPLPAGAPTPVTTQAGPN